jgi:Protein of unknown function (DUF2530)
VPSERCRSYSWSVIGRASSQLRDPDPPGGRTETDPVPVEQPARQVGTVPPLDVTGVRTVAVGAGLWLIAFVALLPFYGTLRDSGRSWWVWTCVTGFALGLVGLEYCRRRRARLARQPDREVETSPLGAAGL